MEVAPGARLPTSAIVTSMIDTSGIPTASRMLCWNTYAVLQGITRKSAPAASSLAAIAASSGPGSSPPLRIASWRLGTPGL